MKCGTKIHMIPLGNVYGKAYREESHNGLAE